MECEQSVGLVWFQRVSYQGQHHAYDDDHNAVRVEIENAEELEGPANYKRSSKNLRPDGKSAHEAILAYFRRLEDARQRDQPALVATLDIFARLLHPRG